jgi:hypothetical protein
MQGLPYPAPHTSVAFARPPATSEEPPALMT